MNIQLRQCEIDIPQNRIVLTIEVDGQIYREERGWTIEQSDEFAATADISNMLCCIFRDISL